MMDLLEMGEILYPALICISSIAVPLVLNYYIKRNYTKKIQNIRSELQEKHSTSPYYYHCIFLTLENIECRQHIFDGVDCGDKCSYTHLRTIIRFIAAAQHSISMCMYHLTLRQVTDELHLARNRGVKVRIICDFVTAQMASSRIAKMQQKFDIEVRAQDPKESYMHHKYCIVDENETKLAKMFLGSLNLTLQGLCSNFEFMVLTNNQEMVNQYAQDFNNLWDTFRAVTF